MKCLLVFCLLFSFSAFAEVIEDRCELTIATPSLKERQTRKLRLENGLEALIISDPNTPQSGAALAVNVGSWDDPKARPGMAHFVEHLLFLGTEKFPEEEGYTRYLDEHGGKRNAFTMSDRTVYMFSVNNDGLSEALDRFGQFFIAPLFSPSGVARECHAIHQEFCRNVPLDNWRALYVKKALANPVHPFHGFCIGNLDTLAQISQDELKQWYKEHYSANLMHLVIYAKADLDTLEKEVVNIFSAVKNSEVVPKKCEAALLHPENMGKLIAITPIQDIQQLEMSWEIPNQDRDVKADRLIGHILGHEGETSLLSKLKAEGYADGLGAGGFHAGKDQTLFSINVLLTSKGLKEYEKVISRCYEAIASIRLSGIPRYIFNELIDLQTLGYTYQSRKDIFDFVSEYAMCMIEEPLETFPRKMVMATRYDTKQIDATLTALTPDRCQYTLIAKPDVTHIQPEHKEKWLGVEYSLKDISKKRLKTWSISTPHPEISIPTKNAYIPNQFALFDTDVVSEPMLLGKNEQGVCYVQTDNEYGVPEVSFIFNFKTPHISDDDCRSQVLADLYCHTIDEMLSSNAYAAMLAGLSYELKPAANGIELSIEGFHDKAGLLLTEILHAMKTISPSKESFATYKSLAQRTYANKASLSPLAQAGESTWNLIYQNYAGVSKKEHAVEKISYDHLKKFTTKLWESSYIEATLYGNVSETQAKHIWLETLDYFNGKPYAENQHYKPAVASFSDVRLICQKCAQPANALILTLDLGPFSQKKRAAMDVLCKGLEEPFFSELRTKQQTAYMIRSWGQEIERHLYAFMAVQSSSYQTRDLLSRFELFLESSLHNLSNEVIPKERFNAIKLAFIENLERPADTLKSKGKLLNTLAFSYDADFNWLEKRKEAFNELTYEEFLELSQAYLGKENKKRVAVCVDGDISQAGGIHYDHTSSCEKLKKLTNYQVKPPLN